MQLWTIPTRPITGHQGEDLSCSLSASPPQEALESSEVAPRLPFLQTGQTQCSQLPLTGDDFQPSHQVCCPFLNAFRDLHILLELWGPELHTVLKVRLHQGWTQRDDTLSWLVGCAVFDAPQDTEVCPPGCQGTTLAAVEPAVDQHPQIPFCRVALQPLLSQFILLPGITPSQVQNPAFGLVQFHPIDDCPMPQSI